MNRFSRETISRFLEFITSHPQGVTTPPAKWPGGDNSWRQGQG